ncbi:MAG: hypothetical protein MUC37_11660 [Hyphomicrobium sp.]|jgi:hypothetical protein|nr:hypothetical protein [Hyphomicrobium sp.]
MKSKLIYSRPDNRVRRFTREILLASAITVAAIIVLTLSRDQTEVAEGPSPAGASVQTPQ